MSLAVLLFKNRAASGKIAAPQGPEAIPDMMKFDDCCCCLPTEPVIAYNSRTRVFHGDKLIYISIYKGVSSRRRRREGMQLSYILSRGRNPGGY